MSSHAVIGLPPSPWTPSAEMGCSAFRLHRLIRSGGALRPSVGALLHRFHNHLDHLLSRGAIHASLERVFGSHRLIRVMLSPATATKM